MIMIISEAEFKFRTKFLYKNSRSGNFIIPISEIDTESPFILTNPTKVFNNKQAFLNWIDKFNKFNDGNVKLVF